MKIALLGYGKMGHAIEEVALQHQHEIVLRSASKTSPDIIEKGLQQCDVVIEFSSPQSALKNIRLAFGATKPVVCGSTGWTDHLAEIKKDCEERNQTIFYASNFSIGVNLFFELNKKLASLMSHHKEYKLMMEEIHHQHKKDYPSGTAITLANDILGSQNKYASYKSFLSEVTSHNATDWFPIFSKRESEEPGTHNITWNSSNDEIVISHKAYNRKGFATGAVIAAEWLQNRKGFFTMSDLLK